MTSYRDVFVIVILACTMQTSCKMYKPEYTYNDFGTDLPDYADLDNWAAHPAKDDEADRMPEGGTVTYDHVLADVFFIHPTTYIGSKGEDKWNASLKDQKLNKKTDEGSIRFQASAFNHAGRVFAPRYRQAHFIAYFTKDTASANKAFERAYRDVRAAFVHYLENENKGRPIILAGHSQGTNHAERLMDEFFTGKPLKNRMVAAYLIGMPLRKDRFADIFPCRDSTDTGCFVSWRTFKKGYELPRGLTSNKVSVTNPLSWKTNEQFMPATANKGSLFYKFDKLKKYKMEARVAKDILWTNKPRFFGSIFLKTRNYHIADINFYYVNIRENAVLRASKFKPGS